MLSKEEADYKQKVRAQNDNVRRNILSSLPMRVQANAQCEVYLTTALAEMCRRNKNMGDLLRLVKDFDDFDQGNDPFILDVREPQEYQICQIPGSVLIPLGDLPKRLVELEGHEDMVVHCKAGVRSAKAVKLLRDAGFVRAKNLRGGILAWIDKIDPSLPKY